MSQIGKGGVKPSPWLGKIERYVSVVSPGDILINPPYFWHGILNIAKPGELVIGVPTRYGMGKASSKAAFTSNPFFNVVTGLTLLKQYGSFEKYYSVVDSGEDLLEDKIEANRLARMKITPSP